MAYDKAGRYEQALKQFNRAIIQSNTFSKYEDSLGMIKEISSKVE